jgi:hypothetical protein
LTGSNTISNCLIEGGTGNISYPTTLPNIFNNIVSIDPDFISPSGSDFRLSDFSPCINAGISDTAGLSLPLTDFNGYPRIFDGRIDIGAFEYQQDDFRVLEEPSDQWVCAGGMVNLETRANGIIHGYQWQKNGINLDAATESSLIIDNASFADTGEYHCLILGNDQTISTDTIQLSVATDFSIAGQTTSLTLCPGTDTLLSVTLAGDQAVAYSWYKNNLEIPGAHRSVLEIPIPEEAQSDTFYCLVSNACKSLTSSDINLDVYELPDLELPEDTTVNAGQTLQLDPGSGYESYSWNTGSENQVLIISELAPGIYKYFVRVSDHNNCYIKDSILVTIRVPNGFMDINDKTGIKIYPNPVQEILYLKPYISIQEEVWVTLTDNGGREVWQLKYAELSDQMEYPIDISGLAPGIYLLSFRSKVMTTFERVIIR